MAGAGMPTEPRQGAQELLTGNTAAGGPKHGWGQCRPPYLWAEQSRQSIFELHSKPGPGQRVGLSMTACTGVCA